MASDGIGFAKGAIHYYRKGLSSAMTAVMTINLPEQTAKSVINGLSSAYEHVMKVENSERTRLIFANLYQKWVYLFYPQYKSYVEQFELKIKELGGSSLKPQGGTLFNMLIKICPWKVIRKIQIALYKSIWRPILVYKANAKLKRQFGIEKTS